MEICNCGNKYIYSIKFKDNKAPTSFIANCATFNVIDKIVKICSCYLGYSL